MKFEDVMGDVIDHKIQSGMREILNKIYPVKICEIRYVGIEEVDKPREETKAEEAQPEVAEAKE